jgi:hypothetical protein
MQQKKLREERISRQKAYRCLSKNQTTPPAPVPSFITRRSQTGYPSATGLNNLFTLSYAVF